MNKALFCENMLSPKGGAAHNGAGPIPSALGRIYGDFCGNLFGRVDVSRRR
jgi:hypothetical protein